jgi:hypothetical protein
MVVSLLTNSLTVDLNSLLILVILTAFLWAFVKKFGEGFASPLAAENYLWGAFGFGSEDLVRQFGRRPV